MTEIKLISENTDLSKIEMHEYDWDAVINDEPYKVYSIPEYVHTIGGRYHDNCLWCCPRNEEPTYYNLIPFNGEAPTYSIHLDELNVPKHHWDDSEIDVHVKCTILRNNKEFYTFVTNNLAYAYADAYRLITDICEGVINFSIWDYVNKEIIGRHVWWKGKPYTLVNYFEGSCCVIAVSGHFDLNDNEEYQGSKCLDDDDDSSVKLDLLRDKHIAWFCKDY